MSDYKFPKDLGECADLLYEIGTRKAKAKAALDEIDAEEKALREYLIENVPKSSAGVMGRHHAVQIKLKSSWRALDWDAFWAKFQPKRDRDLLQKRLSDSALDARLEAGKTVPGVEKYSYPTISLTKIKG